MSSVIRIGTVSKVNYEDGTIEVAYEDRDGSVTDEICVVSNALYRMPVVGAMVCVLHNSDSQEMGTCIGTFWNEDNKPVGGKKQRYRYDYNDKKGKAFEQYDGDSGDYEEKIDGNAKETIGKNLDFTVGGDVTFKVGASTVKVCQSGTIEITGTTVKITGATVNISGGSGDCKINGVSLVNHKHEHDGSAKAGPYTVSGNTGVPVKCLFTFSAPIKRLETVIYIPFFCAFGRIDLYINIAQYQLFQLTAHVYSFSVKVSFPLVSPQNRCTAPHSSATFSSINGF